MGFIKECIDCGTIFRADFSCQQRCPKCRKEYFKRNPDKKKIAKEFIKKKKKENRIFIKDYIKNKRIEDLFSRISEKSPCFDGKIGW